jgi:hypothetical protein
MEVDANEVVQILAQKIAEKEVEIATLRAANAALQRALAEK